MTDDLTDRAKMVLALKDIGIPFREIDKGEKEGTGIRWFQCIELEACAGPVQLAASFQFDNAGKFVRVGLANYENSN